MRWPPARYENVGRVDSRIAYVAGMKFNQRTGERWGEAAQYIIHRFRIQHATPTSRAAANKAKPLTL
jgi:hypothetical protein